MQTSYTLQELAKILDAEIQGESSEQFVGLAPLESANSKQISFIANKKYLHFLKSTRAGAILIDKNLAKNYSKTCLIVADPYLAFAKLTHYFDAEPRPKTFIDESAKIHPSAQIGENVYIGANVVIEAEVKIGANCKIYPQTYIGVKSQIGENTRIYPQVVLYHETQIGKNCIIHSHAVLGAHGFGFAPSAEGWQKIAQLGRVVIEDNVEIGAGTTIDRGALEDTLIKTDVKIDNIVQIAHGVEIGEHTAIAACVGVSGSAKIGSRCLIGGGSGIAGHLKICDGVQIAGKTNVAKDIKTPGVYASFLTEREFKDWTKTLVRLNDLNNLFARVKKLEQQIAKQGNAEEVE